MTITIWMPASWAVSRGEKPGRTWLTRRATRMTIGPRRAWVTYLIFDCCGGGHT